MNRRQYLRGTIGAIGTGAAALALGSSPARALLPPEGVVRMRDLYEKDMSFSDFARKTEGERISVYGFMAPPLKADAHFFVLTKRPMAVCPFCESSADWPADILAVYTKRTLEVIPFNVALIAKGKLTLDAYRDPDTGFFSRVRLTDATYERL